jgi:hypothetical protein
MRVDGARHARIPPSLRRGHIGRITSSPLINVNGQPNKLNHHRRLNKNKYPRAAFSSAALVVCVM